MFRIYVTRISLYHSLENQRSNTGAGGGVVTTAPTCSFDCEPGFYLEGRETIGCSLQGEWDPYPTCEEYQCPSISIVAEEFTAGATCEGGGASSEPDCEFHCAPGYSLLNDVSTITCNIADGTWPTYPSCEVNECTPTEVRGVRARSARILIFFTFLCFYHSNYKNITRVAHSHCKKITQKSILECTLDYDEYLTRTSRSNTGTILQSQDPEFRKRYDR